MKFLLLLVLLTIFSTASGEEQVGVDPNGYHAIGYQLQMNDYKVTDSACKFNEEHFLCTNENQYWSATCFDMDFGGSWGRTGLERCDERCLKTRCDMDTYCFGVAQQPGQDSYALLKECITDYDSIYGQGTTQQKLDTYVDSYITEDFHMRGCSIAPQYRLCKGSNRPSDMEPGYCNDANGDGAWEVGYCGENCAKARCLALGTDCAGFAYVYGKDPKTFVLLSECVPSNDEPNPEYKQDMVRTKGTCNDRMLNGDETGTDCGGAYCAACPTCDDGIQNQNELYIDCGGPCDACVANCVVDLYNPTTSECLCEPNTQHIASMWYLEEGDTQKCDAGQYCYNAQCHSAAKCETQDVDQPFYGAKLEGSWAPTSKEMSLSLPVPANMNVQSISWLNAQDTGILGYVSGEDGLWTVNTDTECWTIYELTSEQDVFFGPGSRFSLLGHQLSSNLDVKVTQAITRTIGGNEYTFDRKVGNAVPIHVNLEEEVIITANFKTQYPQTPEEETPSYIDIDYPADDVTSDEDLIEECNETYGSKHGVQCTGVSKGPDGVLRMEMSGPDDAVNAFVEDVEDTGYESEQLEGTYDVTPEESTHESLDFVLLLEAIDNYAIEGQKTVTFVCEVHSRGCVDHSVEDGGVRVMEESKQYLNEDTAPTTFEWAMDEAGNIAQSMENNLCVETVTWTYAPASYHDGTYDIKVEYSLTGGLGTFETVAEVDIKRADVLATIGFDTETTLYGDAELTEEATSFDIGSMFYAKIQMLDPIIEAAEMNCDKFIVSQTLDGETQSFDMKEGEFNFVQTQGESGSNYVVCAAQLQGNDFHLSVEGFDTELKVDLKVQYKEGTQEDVVTVRRLLTGKRKPDMKEVSAGFEITSSNESYLASFAAMVQNSDSLIYGREMVLVVGLAAAFLTYRAFGKRKSEEYQALIEEV